MNDVVLTKSEQRKRERKKKENERRIKEILDFCYCSKQIRKKPMSNQSKPEISKSILYIYTTTYTYTLQLHNYK